MRVVLSTEMTPPLGRANGFGTLADVLRVAGPSVQAKPIDPASASVLDYRLTISRSDDKQHFLVALKPVKGCGMAWFGDEAGIIFTGKALGC